MTRSSATDESSSLIMLCMLCHQVRREYESSSLIMLCMLCHQVRREYESDKLKVTRALDETKKRLAKAMKGQHTAEMALAEVLLPR
jgi:cytochrome c553